MSVYTNCVNPTDQCFAFFGLVFKAGALVHVYTDGSVLLTHGGTEMGQGLHTKMIQVDVKNFSERSPNGERNA